MLKNLSPKTGSRLRSSLRKSAIAVAILLAVAVTASAYTLVLRNGQRMEIPSDFTLTRTTLTYEVSPGFNKTLQLILIDVAATERANREAPGAFYKHTEETTAVSQPAFPATRTLTNSDLVSIRQRRLASEQAYEQRRKELDLPTVGETRRRQDEEGAVLREQFRAESAAKLREETYWRERARDLRTEIAMVDTQISYVRARLSEVNESSLANRSWVTDVYPLWPNNRQRRGNGRWQPFPGRVARPVYGWGLPNIYGYPAGPFDNFDESAEQADLTNRLDDLQVRRAGLAAQWLALEDEARDARVPQVWLEP